MPEILIGCPTGDGNNNDHCYCGIDNMCCYCRLPLEQARQQQAPTLTTTAAQYRTRYVSQRYTANGNWFVETPTASTTSWGIDDSAPLSNNTISWTPILTTNDEMIESAVFEGTAPLECSDDGSEEVKD